MNDYLIIPFVVFSVAASVCYFICENAYSGIYLWAVILSVLCVVVIFFKDSDNTIAGDI